MTPEDCANYEYFDGFDTCEAFYKELPFGKAVFPVPIELVTECKRVSEDEA